MKRSSQETGVRSQNHLRVVLSISLAWFAYSDSWLLSPDYLASPQQPLRVDVNLVNIFVTVQDERGGYITNLGRDDFRIYEDDAPQTIDIFEKQMDVQSSIGFLMDSSGSMVDILPSVKSGIRDYVRHIPAPDDYFIATFGTNLRIIHKASDGQKHLEENLTALRPYGTSLMYDGLMFAIERIRGAKPERKALIVFSDGHDNGSSTEHGRVVEEAQSTGVLLYFVAIGARVLIDSHTIEDLASVSGGRALYVGKQEPLTPVLSQIQTELAQQYYLGYYAPRRRGFHRIRVEVPGRNLRIRAKTGYLG
ncbi:MAG: VWA domain-containing protein [Acidobacteria bacterium]|nr:VWA domain-containing protein [Acidobacteriota bacterium]